jgi:hypothetical protein
MSWPEKDNKDPHSFILPGVADLPCGTYLIMQGTVARNPLWACMYWVVVR